MEAAFAQRKLREFSVSRVILEHQNVYFPLHSKSEQYTIAGLASPAPEFGVNTYAGKRRHQGKKKRRSAERRCDKAKPAYLGAAKAASMAWVTSGESGTTLDSKRLRIFPSRPIKNLLKFHLMSPG